jgi:hypothetical protein
MSWTDLDGWPVPHPTKLREAVRSIPGGDRLSDERVDGLAGIIAAVADGGREEELPRARPASQAATDAQLAKLHDLAKALADRIDRLNRPAVAALFGEGTQVFEVQRLVRQTQEAARHAWGAEVPSEATGLRKIQAAEVTAITANVFEQVSGRRPTFTTDAGTGDVSGDWPRVLGLVFAALYIEASVPSQVRALRREFRYSKTGAKLP